MRFRNSATKQFILVAWHELFLTYSTYFIDGETFKLFTTGYSDQLLSYTLDKETNKVVLDKQFTVEPNFSFGHVSETYNSVYFVHTVNDYDGNSNTGAVSRWTMGETLTKHEVNSQLKFEQANLPLKMTKIFLSFSNTIHLIHTSGVSDKW